MEAVMEPVVLQSRQCCLGAALHYTLRRQCHWLLHIQGLEQQVSRWLWSFQSSHSKKVPCRHKNHLCLNIPSILLPK